MPRSANNEQLSICFYGSSDEGLKSPLAALHKGDVEKIVSQVLDLKFNSFQIITGGYGGIMDLVAHEFKKQSQEKSKTVQIVGVTCDAYEFEDPEDTTKKYNKSNDYSLANDIVIQAESFPARIQAMIELSDVFVILPGKQGTLGEFLITVEAHAYPINILKNKNYKILVHKYWKPLIKSSHFRRFKTINYFDSATFFKKIRTFTSAPKNYLSERGESFANIPGAFKNLRLKIEQVLHGRIADNPKLAERLKYKSNILAIDFGWYLLSNSTADDGGEYLTYSTKTYKDILNSFFEEKNSIMFNENNSDSEIKVAYLNGKMSSDIIEEDNATELEPLPINKPDEKKPYPNFDDWASFLENGNKYGQTLFWRSVTNKGEKNSFKLNMSIFLLFNCYLPSRKIEKIRQQVDSFFVSVSSKKTSDLFGKKEKELENQAIRAAISQVMARNTSHNIGAHVMNKLIGDLRSLSLLLFDQQDKQNYKSSELKEIHKNTVERLEKETWFTNASDDFKNGVLKNEILLDQISIFNNYVKCRMDYLADISFGTPLMQTNKYAYGELFTELDKVRLLLEYISGLSDFKYKIEFKKNDKPLNGTNDLLVAIPNDILGTQAFYNILENIIRNTAKHSQKDLANPITTFTVNFIDEYDKEKIGGDETEINNILNEYIALEVYDSIDINGNAGNLTDEDKAKYKEDTKKSHESISKIDWLVYSQNRKLNEDILQDKDKKLRSSSLGLVEMDASAAYLRKRDVSFINHPSYQLDYNDSWSRDTELNKEDPIKLRGTNCRHFLKAFKKVEDDRNHLAYRFFLHRPAVVLVVTNKVPGNKEELKKQGVWVVSPKSTNEKEESFEKHLKEGKVYSHEFVVVESNIELPKVEEVDFLEYYKTSLPIRVLEVAANELKKLFAAKEQTIRVDCNQIENSITKTLLDIWEEKCWELWETKLKSSELYGIVGEIKIGNSVGDVCHTTECNCDKGNEFNAAILDHGKHNWDSYRYCKKVDYLDDFSNKAFEKLPRLKTKLATNSWKNYLTCLRKNPSQRHKLRESVISKILAIDERIQNQIGEVYYAENGIKILIHEVYTRSGIIIPNLPVNSYFEEDKAEPSKSKFNLSADDISIEFGKALKKYIEYYINAFQKTDFILIHYSILERIFKNETANKTAKINDFLNEISKENSPQIIITSGRGGGALKELTSKVRFVNLSSVITSFVEIRSKYYSNYLLHSTRKNNSEN